MIQSLEFYKFPKIARLSREMIITEKINDVLNDLKENGSYASKGFMNSEGIVVFHTAANICFKKTIENDNIHKSSI